MSNLGRRRCQINYHQRCLAGIFCLLRPRRLDLLLQGNVGAKAAKGIIPPLGFRSCNDAAIVPLWLARFLRRHRKTGFSQFRSSLAELTPTRNMNHLSMVLLVSMVTLSPCARLQDKP